MNCEWEGIEGEPGGLSGEAWELKEGWDISALYMVNSDSSCWVARSGGGNRGG